MIPVALGCARLLSVGKMCGHCVATAWRLRHTCAATAWQLHGKCAAAARQLRGNCAAAVWQRLHVVCAAAPQNDKARSAVSRLPCLQPIAARILMKMLYAARMARYDLVCAIQKLAVCVTTWSPVNDRGLHRLVC